MCHSLTLQKAINIEELSQLKVDPRVTIESEETYVEWTLPTPYRFCDEPRVLWVRWNIQQDQLIISLDSLAKIATQVSPNKTNVVSVIRQIYDPLGFLFPVTIQYKKLIQKVCKAKLEWDQALQGELLNEWNRLVWDLEVSEQIAVYTQMLL